MQSDELASHSATIDSFLKIRNIFKASMNSINVFEKITSNKFDNLRLSTGTQDLSSGLRASQDRVQIDFRRYQISRYFSTVSKGFILLKHPSLLLPKDISCNREQTAFQSFYVHKCILFFFINNQYSDSIKKMRH